MSSQSSVVGEGASGDDRLPARSMWRLLADPSIGPYFSARLLGSIGVWIHNIVAAVIVYRVSGSALLVGLVSVAQFGPQILLAVFMGALADRKDRRRQALLGHLVAAMGPAVLAISLMRGGELTQAAPLQIILTALTVGIGFAIAAPAAKALVPSLVKPSELSSVLVLIMAPMTLARAIGPVIGAVILLAGGPALGFAVVSATQLSLCLALWLMRVPPSATPQAEDRSAWGGFRFLRKDIPTAVLLGAVATLGFGVDPLITLGPAIAESLGGEASLAAALASAFGIGAAIYFLLFGLVNRLTDTVLVSSLGLCLLSAGLAGLAASRSVALTLASALVGGIGMMAAVTSLSTRIHERVPEYLRGRIMGLWLIAWVGSRPLAAVVNGIVADKWSAQVALVGVAMMVAVGGAAAHPAIIRVLTGESPSVRPHEQPS